MRIDPALIGRVRTWATENKIALASAVAAMAFVALVAILATPQRTVPPAPVASAPVPAAPGPEIALTTPPAPEAVPAPSTAAEATPPAPSAPAASGPEAQNRSPVAAGKPGMESAQPKVAEKPKAKAKSKDETKVASLPPKTPPVATPVVPIDTQAQGYVSFTRDVDTVYGMTLDNPTQVRDALSRLRKHEPKQMAQGWIVYGAKIAAGNDEFKASLVKEVEKRGRDGVQKRIDSDPMYLFKLDGAYNAMNDVLGRLASQTGKLDELKKRFIQTAYDFQKIKKWGALDPSLNPSLSPSGMLASLSPSAPEVARAYVIPAGLFSKSSPKPSLTPIGPTDRAMKLAARLAMGDTPEDIAAISSALITDKGLEQCLRWAKLNTNQCMAAAHFPSEEAYCTGTHQIAEVSACWSQLLPAKS